MNSDAILRAIDDIANTSKKTEKEALVKKHATDDDFIRVLEYAYNPFKKYGITKPPKDAVLNVEPPGECREFNETTWEVLDMLIAREVTGDAAKITLAEELDALTDESADLLMRIIRKDLRAGFSDSTINKAKKGTIPVFPYMRCSLTSKVDIANEFSWEMGVPSQEKADGMFANLDIEMTGIVNISSRQGSPFPLDEFGNFITEALNRLKRGMQYHGEFLVALNGEILPREKSNGVMNRILKGGKFEEGETLVYKIWDAIPLEYVKPKGKYELSYRKRLKGIVQNLSETKGEMIVLISTRIVKSVAEAYEHYAEMLAQGKEGTVVKEPTGIWRDGTSKHQVKMKLEVDVDLKVVAIEPGRDGTKNEGRAGTMVCETSDGLLQVGVAVKNEAMRDHVDANPDEWIGSIIVVRSNEILKPSASNDLHSLFLPRMVEADYRTDKTEADSLEQVFDQFEAAKKGEMAKAA